MRSKNGSVLIAFFAILGVIAILGLYIASSFLVQKGRDYYDGFEGGEIDMNYAELEKYYSLNSLLNCEGEFNGKKMHFYEVLNFWDDSNQQDVIDFVSESKCNEFFVAVNEHVSESFWCNQNKCNMLDDYGFMINENFLEFQLSPYKIKLFAMGFKTENE